MSVQSELNNDMHNVYPLCIEKKRRKVDFDRASTVNMDINTELSLKLGVQQCQMPCVNT